MEGQIIEDVWILEIVLDDFFCKRKWDKIEKIVSWIKLKN